MAERYLVATFETERPLLEAAREVRAAGVRVHDVFAPYYVHGLDEILEVRRSRLPYITLAGGAFGCISALGFQLWSTAVSWPVNVGGKPLYSTVAFIPITFEATVLLGGLATAAAFLWRSRLFPGLQPKLPAPRVTDDRFALVLGMDGTGLPEVRRLLEEAGAESVTEEVRAP